MALRFRIWSSRLLPFLALIVLTSCTNDPRYARQTDYIGGQNANPNAADGYDPVSYWDGNGLAGEPSIDVRLGEQRAYFYKGGQLVGVSQISTGREGHGTPAGSYTVIGKSRDHVSNRWGNFVDASGNVVVPSVSVVRDKAPAGTRFEGSPMPFFIRLTNSGIGLHAGYLPGYPASAGCIRMPRFMAEHFFTNVTNGTPVRITH